MVKDTVASTTTAAVTVTTKGRSDTDAPAIGAKRSVGDGAVGTGGVPAAVVTRVGRAAGLASADCRRGGVGSVVADAGRHAGDCSGRSPDRVHAGFAPYSRRVTLGRQVGHQDSHSGVGATALLT